LLELTNGHEEAGYFTPDELMGHIKPKVALSSKRDLGLMLGRLGLHSRILYRNGNEARYYELLPTRLRTIYESR